jgi:hypothetical protein
MKTRIYCLIIFLYGSLLNAQDFSTKFYITNKHDAKDSLELGYSGSATFGIDSQFGEVGYSTPVNADKFRASIIVRGNNGINSFSKKQIIPFQQSVWIEQNAVGIMVPVDSMPITISWDKTHFENIQRNYSLITDWTLGGWFDAGGASFLKYLKDTNFIQIKDRTANYIFSDGINQYPMYIFYIAFGEINNIETNIKRIRETKLSDLAVYKNGLILINQEIYQNIKQVNIYNASGKLEFHKSSILTHEIDISNYNKGVYFVFIETNKGQFSFKIIKI